MIWKKWQRFAGGLLGALLLTLIMSMGNVLAAGTPVATGGGAVSVTILGGALVGVIGIPTVPVGLTLTGNAQSFTYQLPSTVTDLRGTGGGWNLTITSTQFTTTGGSPTTLPTTASTIQTTPTETCSGVVVLCTPAPTDNVSTPLNVPADVTAPTAVEFYNAAVNTGEGSFIITPTITVGVPASTAPGIYSSTVTVALTAGP